MAGETFSLTYADIRQQVGDAMGFGLNITDWEEDADKATRVAMILKEGVNIFYNAFKWSFLEPVRSLTIPTAVDELELPSDFGNFTDKIYFTDSGSNWGRPLCIQNDGKILAMRQSSPDETGMPQMAAEVPIEPTMQRSSRTKLILWPTSDQAYAIQVRFKVTGSVLSADNPFPYGGPVHAITILHSCLAVAERKDGTIAVNNQQYRQSLATSIENDKLNKAQSISPLNRPRGYGSQWPHIGVSTVTYEP